MDTQKEVLAVLDDVLSLHGRTNRFNAATPLLGALPELDSMAIVSVITALEDHFDLIVEDDDLDGSTFETVGSLVAFIERKLQ